ncbi:MAG: DNA translocase FtsK [Chloroflexi bacterium]|nr:DNA translocase FtsK [Chloroflexota bacterium]
MLAATSVTQEYLEFQSNRIEAVLASHRVPARVHGGAVSPRWIRFHLTPAIGARIATVRNLSEELALALGAADVRIAREGQSLAVEVPRPDAKPVRLLPFLRGLHHLPPLTACLGISEDGRPLLLRLPAPDVAHVLIAGTTGSGKTELMRSMVMSLAVGSRQATLQIALIDPKMRGLAPLADLRHLIAPPAATPPAALDLLRRLADEMIRRDADGVSTPHIAIVVDETLDLLMTGGKEVESLLTRIAQRGREAGLHLILGAQKPSAAALGGMLRANFPVRLVGKVASADDARIAAGLGASGAEKLQGRGDFIAIASGQVTRFQAAFLPAPDWAELHRAMAQGARIVGTRLDDEGD